jgi:hypothetical protein
VSIPILEKKLRTCAVMKKEGESTENPNPVRPIEKAVENEITSRLDRAAREAAPAPGLAVQQRSPTAVKIDETNFHAKTAEALCRLKTRRRLREFKGRK